MNIVSSKPTLKIPSFLKIIFFLLFVQAVASGQAPWQVYFLLADVELKFGVSSEALNMLSNAKSRMKNVSDDQEFIIMKCEAEALIATQQELFLQKSVALCEKVSLRTLSAEGGRTQVAYLTMLT